MMGFLSGAGSLGSILGPLLLTSLYHEEGPIVGYLVFIGVVIIAVLSALAFYTRLVPYSVYKKKITADKDHGGYAPIGSDEPSKYGSINAEPSTDITEKSHHS